MTPQPAETDFPVPGLLQRVESIGTTGEPQRWAPVWDSVFLPGDKISGSAIFPERLEVYALSATHVYTGKPATLAPALSRTFPSETTSRRNCSHDRRCALSQHDMLNDSSTLSAMTHAQHTAQAGWISEH